MKQNTAFNSSVLFDISLQLIQDKNSRETAVDNGNIHKPWWMKTSCFVKYLKCGFI
jgi:hypothetical protein